MAGRYIFPLKREFLNLSGGTVTGDTYVAANFSADTIFSGSTDLGDIISNITTTINTGATRVQDGLNTYTGGTNINPTVNISGLTIDNIFVSGDSSFNTLTAGTINVDTSIFPSTDNAVDIGSSTKRFRSLTMVNGVATSFTASTKVRLGSRDMTEYNVILTGDTIDAGDWS